MNTTAVIYHPFHIHVNPFQVVESFDPSKDLAPQKVTDNAIWWDTICGSAVDLRFEYEEDQGAGREEYGLCQDPVALRGPCRALRSALPHARA